MQAYDMARRLVAGVYCLYRSWWWMCTACTTAGGGCVLPVPQLVKGMYCMCCSWWQVCTACTAAGGGCVLPVFTSQPATSRRTGCSHACGRWQAVM